MVNRSRKCDNDECKELAESYCFLHRTVICKSCTEESHIECKVDTIKSREETTELVQYLTILVNRLRTICEDQMAERMIKESIGALKPFFFEFNIFRANFNKAVKESNDCEETCTVMFYKFQKFNKSLKENSAYSQVIEFEFEQSVCKMLQEEKINESSHEGSPKQDQVIRKPKLKASSPNVNSQCQNLIFVKDENKLPSDQKPMKKVPQRRISMRQSGIRNLFSEQEYGDKGELNSNSDYQSYGSKPVPSTRAIRIVKQKKMLMTPEKKFKQIEFMIRPVSDKQLMIRDLKERLDNYRKNKSKLDLSEHIDG